MLAFENPLPSPQLCAGDYTVFFPPHELDRFREQREQARRKMIACYFPGAEDNEAWSLTGNKPSAESEQGFQQRREVGLELVVQESHQPSRPRSRLLELPFEIRRQIFDYALTTTVSFPPTTPSSRVLKSLAPSLPAPLGLTTSATNTLDLPVTHDALDSSKPLLPLLLVSRQIWWETRLSPFRVNTVSAPTRVASNIAATHAFLRKLNREQRRSIRSLDVRMVATATDAWGLKGLLSCLAGVEGVGRRTVGTSNLRELNLTVTTKDLLIPASGQTSSFLRLLALGSAIYYFGSSSDASAEANKVRMWVEAGLVFLKNLRKLTVEVEVSQGLDALLAVEKRQIFSDRLAGAAPWVQDMNVRWTVMQEKVIDIDEVEWLDFLRGVDGDDGDVDKSSWNLL